MHLVNTDKEQQIELKSGFSRKIEINGSKEVKITGTRKITRDSKNIFLKSSISQVQSPLQKVAFIRGAYRVRDSATRKDLGDEF